MQTVKKRSIYASTCLAALAAATFWGVVGCRPAPQSLVILHTNDIHGTFQPFKIKDNDRVRLVGGMEAASSYIEGIRERERDVVLIETGDIMTGTFATVLPYRGVSGGAMPEFLNLLGYDIRCYGNHAFDQGIENVRAIEQLMEFPTVMANIIYKDSGELFARERFHVIKKGKVRIGVIAVMEEFFLTEVSPDMVAGLDVLPIVPTLKRWVPVVRRASDLVVAVVHSKFYDGQRVAREVPGVDVILVASEDGRFEEIDGVLVKSTRGHLRTLGYLKLTVQGSKILDFEQDLIWLWADGELKPQPEVTALVQEIESSIEEDYRRIIGKSAFDYICPGYDSIENALGNWITDVMRWKTGADIALLNSGGIRSDIYSGPITVRALYEVSPFQNILVEFNLSGRQLKQVFETDIKRGRDRMQISGMRYTYYPAEARPPGRRVNFLAVGQDVVVRDGELLLPDRIFRVVSNEYIVEQSKDKYFGFQVEDHRNTRILLTKAMVEWLELKQLLFCSLEDRIVEIKSDR